MYTYESIHEPKQSKYHVAESIREYSIEYFFTSTGERNILKMVIYSFLEELNGKKLFNFGFGDYNLVDGRIADNVISNNGDAYKVFNTVLSTVPRFFEIHHDAMIRVNGSDSSPEFVKACRSQCRKNCAGICKNSNRRIDIYRGYVNKHYNTLKGDYTFYGGLDRTGNESTMIDYIPDQKQQSIFLLRNKNQYNMKTEENQTQEFMEPTSPEEMIALCIKQREASNWADLFAEQNARAREEIKGLVLPKHLWLDK